MCMVNLSYQQTGDKETMEKEKNTMKELVKEEKMENLKTQNTRRKNEGMDAFDGFEEVEDIVTAGDKGSIACCRDV